MSSGFEIDWSELPIPEDDGEARHLAGSKLKSVKLLATDGNLIDLAQLSGRTVVYIYPMTGRPDRALPDGWNEIPGARGCTPQSCSFRDHFAELKRLGVDHLFGLSSQTSEWQKEAAQRLHLPFALLSDAEGNFRKTHRLPHFETGGMTLLKRMTLVIEDGRIRKVYYPVFPPDQSAQDVIDWLKAHANQ